MWKITRHHIASHHTVHIKCLSLLYCMDRKRKMVRYSSSMRLLWMLAENSCKQSIKWMTSRYLHPATKPGMIQWCRISLGKCVCVWMFMFVYGLFIHYVQYDHKILTLNNQQTKRKLQKETESQLRYIRSIDYPFLFGLCSPLLFVLCLRLLS